MRVLVIGGTGLLGHATAAELLTSGHEVTVLARTRPPAPLPVLDRARLVLGDDWTMPDDDLRRLCAGADALVYALGPDDRAPVPAPAAAYFERHLVQASARVFTLAAQAGVGAATLFGSYFTAWARTHPGFAGRHPYVAARQRQAAACVTAGGDTTAVTVLEVPWVFGTVPGRDPMWKQWLLPRIRGPVVPFPRGGTTLATARTCGRTAAAALEHGRAGAHYPVGDADWDWNRIIATAREALGLRPAIVNVPRVLAEPAARQLGRQHRRAGVDAGIDPAWLMRDLMYTRMFTDHAATRAELGVPVDDVAGAIRATMLACR